MQEEEEQEVRVPSCLDELLDKIELLTQRIFPPGLHAKQSAGNPEKQHRHLHDDQPEIEEAESQEQEDFEYLSRQPSCKNLSVVVVLVC
jgi:hypothetical protein